MQMSVSMCLYLFLVPFLRFFLYLFILFTSNEIVFYILYFILLYFIIISLITVCFPLRERMGVNSDERADRESLGGVEEGETVIKIY